MQDIPDDDDFQPVEVTQMFPDGVDIQQTLGGVGMYAISRVNNADGFQVLCQQVGSTGMGVPDHDHIHAHGLNSAGGVA